MQHFVTLASENGGVTAVVFPEIGGFYSAIFYKSGVVKVSDFMSSLCNFLKSVLNIFVRPQGLFRRE